MLKKHIVNVSKIILFSPLMALTFLFYAKIGNVNIDAVAASVVNVAMDVYYYFEPVIPVTTAGIVLLISMSIIAVASFVYTDKSIDGVVAHKSESNDDDSSDKHKAHNSNGLVIGSIKKVDEPKHID